jgi:hypothetical protein
LLDSLSGFSLKDRITVWDGAEGSSLPEWAAALVWLGDWCRRTQFHDRRLIVFATLPSRELAAAFVAFGAMLGGARSFKDSLSWSRFRNKSIGSVVYWRERQGTKRFAGAIVKFEEMHGTELITLKVIKPAAVAKKGGTTSIGRGQFDNYLFTEEEPPTSSRSSAFSQNESLMKKLLGYLNPKWIWADGAESILVTQMTGFGSAIADLSLSCDEISPVPMLDLLCIARSNESTLAKLRISHSRGKLDGKYPLAILDGPEAFYGAHEHLAGTSNILTILDRSEYSEGISDKVLELGAIASDVHLGEFGELPASFLPGVELAAYVVPNW